MHKSHKKKRCRDRHQKCKSISIEDDDNNFSDESRDGKYIIKQSNEIGRYIVAAETLKPGSLIIREYPLIAGPCPSSAPVCLNCHQTLPSPHDTFPCSGCRWPQCARHCPGRWHSAAECKILSASDGPIPDIAYHAISPLRCLLLQDTEPDKWRVLKRMEHHETGRKECKERWDEEGREVVERIRQEWGQKRFSEKDIRDICGILQVNAFEVGRRGVSLLALYPRAYLLSHDCTPNTTHTDEDNTFRLSIHAATSLSAGQPITLSYTYTLQGTASRRHHLRQGKFFWCQCSRCADSTEIETHASSLRCPKCKEGWVLAQKPLDEDTIWECVNENCVGYKINGETVKKLMDKITNEVESIDGNDVTAYEDFLERYRNVLHPQHYHFLGVKHSLSQLYGRVSGYLIHQLSPMQLNRKLQICTELMKVFDVLEPGFSRLRGTTLYELHAPLMMLATRDFETKIISKQELRTRLLQVVRCLKESSTILNLEPDNSQEKIMACAAEEALLRIRDWEKVLGKLC